MQEIDILWDSLAGMLKIYVDNYFIHKNGGGRLKLSPSYIVDYDIEEGIILEMQRSCEKGEIQNIWYHSILACRNINELPPYLKKLVEQFLPRFLSEYPQYQDMECLKIISEEI